MEHQKVCKQDRDDIKVKVSIQSPIPISFNTTVANWCENDAGMRLCKFFLHSFWHTIPTSFLHFNVFKSCFHAYFGG